jgi:hypothetical protein
MSLDNDEIIIEQWKTLVNLFNTKFMDFINTKISHNDIHYTLFSELAKTESPAAIMDILYELCQGCKALMIENNNYFNDHIGQQLQMIKELVVLFGPEHVDAKPKLENANDIESYYIRRNYSIINQWKCHIYNELDEQFGSGKYKDFLPKDFRKFPLLSETKIPW